MGFGRAATYNPIAPMAGGGLSGSFAPQNPSAPSRRTIAYHLNLLPVLSMSPRRVLREMLKQPGTPNAVDIGYLTIDSDY